MDPYNNDQQVVGYGSINNDRGGHGPNVSINDDDTGADEKTQLIIKDDVQQQQQSEPDRPIHMISMISIMAVGFIANIEYGIVMPSINGFIESKDSRYNHMNTTGSDSSGENTSDSYLGWAISGFSVTQLVFLPLVGIWADRRSIREAISVCILIGIIGNVVYATAINPVMIVMGRVIAGIGSANMALTTSYISAVSSKEQRTKYMGKINGINAIGLVAGPAFNLLLALCKFDIKIGKMDIKVTPYNSPGYMLAFLLTCCLVSFIWFKEPERMNVEEDAKPIMPVAGSSYYNYNNAPSQRVIIPTSSNDITIQTSISQITAANHQLSFNYRSISRSMRSGRPGTAMMFNQPKEDSFWTNFKKLLNASLLTCFVINFVQNLVFGALETMITPITQYQYNFTTLDNSIMYSVVSTEIIVFIFATVFASNYGIQDKYLILFGQVFLGAGLIQLLFFFGVPATEYVPMWQFCLAVGITTVGIPTQNTSIYSLYSKLLNRIFGEEAQQGFQSGFMMLMGSLARIVGPLWASYGLTMANRFPLFIVLVALWVFDIGVTLIFFKSLTFVHTPGQKAVIVGH
ncbi:hypothetical protein SAMD00019534_039250 [Acytostelium subglobosum LB1]|uniref:hypothetical protein n=1 Tax=Acytostelium subglobosum LB1 TaxID=1410327 RepID=UPI000644CAA2|nr:hypothetical protein SAMD00019534_039250 [Acytostelium subglobosum LB1]GAM20750.1 hypothetical protein SAMD00019534_039250 [Acytostelium subglobosum LB1]|eukprot:XP_012755884.1 hypothetical protein SAMD00019534_039250 [Acytostelium subglobosum LB1]